MNAKPKHRADLTRQVEACRAVTAALMALEVFADLITVGGIL